MRGYLPQEVKKGEGNPYPLELLKNNACPGLHVCKVHSLAQLCPSTADLSPYSCLYSRTSSSPSRRSEGRTLALCWPLHGFCSHHHHPHLKAHSPVPLKSFPKFPFLHLNQGLHHAHCLLGFNFLTQTLQAFQRSAKQWLATGLFLGCQGKGCYKSGFPEMSALTPHCSQ